MGFGIESKWACSAWTWQFALFVSLSGCTGQIGFAPTGEGDGFTTEPGEPGAGLPGDPEDPGAVPPLLEEGACADATPARLWRLSHRQYENEIGQLLGKADQIASDFEPEASGTGFRNGAAASFVSGRLAEDYSAAAEDLAAEAIENIGDLLSCDPKQASCAIEFIEAFGEQAFRRPLDAEQSDLYLKLYELEPGVQGIGLVIEAMLQSPYFLYRFELGSAGAWGERVRLTDAELAAQLSFLLWDQSPDETLLGAVHDGTLATDAGVTQQVDRMLDDPRAQNFFWKFLEQHFDFDVVPSLTKDRDLFPLFTSQAQDALVEEARSFSNDVIWNRTATLPELFTSNTAHLNDELASYYGVSGAEGVGFEPIEMDPEQRVGLLTHGGFQSVLGHAEAGSPTLRGGFVRTQLLCHQIPEPPDDVDDAIDPPGESTTTRERYQEHLVSDSCKGCHALTDPIGFGFENFDTTGRYRTSENGQPIDATGYVANLGGVDVSFDGPRELIEALLDSEEVYDCLSVHFFRYVLGRLDENFDECTIGELQESFRGTTGRLPELLRQIVVSGAFTHRVKQ